MFSLMALIRDAVYQYFSKGFGGQLSPIALNKPPRPLPAPCWRPCSIRHPVLHFLVLWREFVEVLSRKWLGKVADFIQHLYAELWALLTHAVFVASFGYGLSRPFVAGSCKIMELSTESNACLVMLARPTSPCSSTCHFISS